MKRILTALFIAGFQMAIVAQDALFVNNQQSLVYLNPSFSGSNGGIRNQLTYRNQWPNLSGTFVTMNNSFDAFIKPIKGGISVNLFTDNQARGTIRTTALSIAYAQHFSLMENTLKIIPSFQFGYFKHTLDRGRLNFGNIINPRNGFVWSTSGTVPKAMVENYDLSAGLLINFKNTFFGASVFHMNEPDEGFIGVSKMPYRLNIHASHNHFASENLLLHFFTQYTQQFSFNYLKIQVNSLLHKHYLISTGISSGYLFSGIGGEQVIILGAGYRHNYFAITLNYDRAPSELSGNTAGSWELNASFNLRDKEKRKEIVCFENW